MGSLIGLIAGRSIFGRTITDGAAKVIAYAGLVLLLLGASAGLLAAYNHHIIGQHEAKQVARTKPATDQAATERANDAIAITKNEEEMHDVIASQPDQPIAPTSHARACLQLRRAGKHSASCK